MARPTSPNAWNSVRSPAMASLTPRVSSFTSRISSFKSRIASHSADMASDSNSSLSFSFPFPFVTLLFFDGPASDSLFPGPTMHILLRAWQTWQDLARVESLQKHFFSPFLHPSHTFPSFTVHVTLSSTHIL